MQVVRTILVILEVLASIGLVLVVLFQSGKESGLGTIAGNTETYMGKNSTSTLDKKLASWTKWIALAWVVLIIAVHCV